MEIEDVVAKLRYGVDRGDAEQEVLERMGRVRPPAEADNPIREKEVYCRGRMLAAVGMALGQIAGVAVIFQAARPSEVLGIGSEASLPRWQEAMRELVQVQRRGDKARLHRATVAAMQPHLPAYAMPQRERRIRLLAVQHRVCNRFPALRVMREGGRQPGQAEVWLRPSAPGLVLGGCVWVPGYYGAGLHFHSVSRYKSDRG